MSEHTTPERDAGTSESGCSVPAAKLVIGKWYWKVDAPERPNALFLWTDECCGPFAYEQTFTPELAVEYERDGSRFFGPIAEPNLTNHGEEARDGR